MLRPERMSKVSVTGSRAVMGDVVDAIHRLNLLHVSEYRGEFEGFEPGDPVEGADAASERLVTVRSLESILGVDGSDAGPRRIVDEAAIEETLPEIRDAVNELDDRRDALRDELRDIDERIEAVEPFAGLDLDLEYLTGYDSLETAVGEADPEAVEQALARRTDVRAYDVTAGDGVVAAFVYPSEGATGVLAEALADVDFARLEVPEESGSPSALLAELRREREAVESKIEGVDAELEELRAEHGAFLLAAEETLTIEVQKAEAPLSFATTDRAFVAEGWIPTEEYTSLVESLRDTVGDRVEVEELERASYTPSHGHSTEAVADGGTVGADDEPPVVQDTPAAAKPFELLVETISKPLYWELDPTVLVLLTFPLFFGFMIGDLAYGIAYMAIGYLLWTRVDSDALRSLGGIAMWSGAFTMLFGVLYGEVLGTHLISTYLWEGAVGLAHAPIEKGLHGQEYANLWLTLSLLVGVVHVTVGYVFGFVNDWRAHGLRDAVLEDLTWVALFVGVWSWLFSTQGAGSKPAFLVGPESVFNGNPVGLGFTGLPAPVLFDVPIPAVGTLPLTPWLGLVVVGFAGVVYAEGAVGALETPNALVNVLSYIRIAIVLLAKAGMAFVVNLLVFGAYEEANGEVHFTYGGAADVPGETGVEVLFGGLVHEGILGILLGAAVLVFGHVVVFLLGITSAGLQAVRLQYVEFFNKFYEGGGANYSPFGHRRKYTTED